MREEQTKRYRVTYEELREKLGIREQITIVTAELYSEDIVITVK